MIPSFKEDEKTILSWLSSDNILFYVTKNGLFRTRADQPRSAVELVVKVEHSVLSAWFSNCSGQLSLLSRESVTVIDPWSLRTVSEYQIVKSKVGEDEDSWICEVPGSWVVSITGHQILELVHIVYQSGDILMIDLKSKKNWHKKASLLSRGQFLVKFVNPMISSSLVISSFSQLTVLVPQSLKCSFLQSSIQDIQWNSETLFILTVKKEVWKICRDPTIKINRIFTNCSLMCLRENLLTVLTSDGAVYKFMPEDCHGPKLKPEVSVISPEKNDSIYNNIQIQANYLEAVGDIAHSLDVQIAQVQQYHLLSKIHPIDVEKMLTFSVVVDVERRIFNCTLKATSPRIKLQGKFWTLQIRVVGSNSEDKIITLSTALPSVFTETSEPLFMKVVIPENYTVIPTIVEALLLFNVSIVKSEMSKLFPKIRLKSQKLDLLDLLELRTEVNYAYRRGQCEEDLFKTSIGLFCSFLPRETITLPYENIGKCVKLEKILKLSIQKATLLNFNGVDLRIKSEISKRSQEVTIVIESGHHDLLHGIKRKILAL